jgi:hypothetical protein
MASRHRPIIPGYFLSSVILRRIPAEIVRHTRRPSTGRADSYTRAQEGRRSHGCCRLRRASPSVESAGGIASPALCIAECRSLVQLRSHSHQQRRAAAQFELLCGPHAVCPSRRDQPKLRDTADRLGDWRNGTIARQCGRGETGNRAGFRCPCSRELEGSSPSARTDPVAVFAQVDSGFHVRATPLGHAVGTFWAHFPVGTGHAE